jgi:hypothetical protein
MPAPTQITSVLNSHNARIAHIRKFCAIPPERGHTLRIITIEDPPQCLGEWSRGVAQDSASVPADVELSLQEHAKAQRAQVRATLAWLDEDGGLVVSKRLTVPYQPDASDEATETAAALDGSERQGLVQQQTLLDKHARMYINAHQTQVAQLTGLVRDLGTMLAESHKQAHIAHLELDKQRLAYRKELERMVDAELPPGGEDDERAAMVQQIAGGLGQALPFLLQGVVQKFLGGGGAAAAPANTNAQAAPAPARAPKSAPKSDAPAAALPAAGEPPAAPTGGAA